MHGPVQPDDHDGASPSGWGGASSDGPSADVIGAWRADAAIDERRSRLLARQRLDDELDLVSTLTNRAEAGRPVGIDLAGGQRHIGHLWWVGTAAVGLRSVGATDLIIALGAVAAVRDAPGRVEVHQGGRTGVPSPRATRSFGSGSLIEALAALAGDELEIAVFGRLGTPLAGGRLGPVGTEVFVVDEPDGARAVITMHSVGWVLLDP